MRHLAIDVIEEAFLLGGKWNFEAFLVEVVVECEGICQEDIETRGKDGEGRLVLMDSGIGKLYGTIVCFVEELVIGRLGHIAKHIEERGNGVGMEDVGNGKIVSGAIPIGRMVDYGLFH